MDFYGSNRSELAREAVVVNHVMPGALKASRTLITDMQPATSGQMTGEKHHQDKGLLKRDRYPIHAALRRC